MPEWLDVKIALDELRTADEPHKIDGDVYLNACKIADAMSDKFSAPTVWASGGKSVVFDWKSFLLTITASKSFAMYSPH